MFLLQKTCVQMHAKSLESFKTAFWRLCLHVLYFKKKNLEHIAKCVNLGK